MTQSLSETIKAANQVLIVDGQLAAVGDYFASDYLVNLTDHEMTGGHKIVKDSIKMLRHSFPDVRLELEVFLESDTRIAWQRTLRGTHRAAYRGFPATGQQLVWRDMVVTQFRDGLIAQEWLVTDVAEQLLRTSTHKK